jgi:long-chain acyl-CoA synthetase
MFVRLLRLPEDERARFAAPKLDLVLHGAAPVSVAVKRRMIEWWGEVFVEYWGATEGGVNTLVDSAEWLDHPGTVGRALPAFEIFAIDAAGRQLPPGETGDLYCRDTRFARAFEYHGDPEKTNAAYLEPGVFTIGDIGSVDENGWVYLADRKSSMIISGGVNIYPAEVEHVLQEHPAVADVGVFGIPDDEWGESVKAAVELVPGREPSPELAGEILAFARERLAAYKVPRSIDFEDELPRHATGKLYTRRLRDRYWQGRDRQI